MIQFFDPHKTGDEQVLFNGGYPFIHWAEPFSTGVIRYKSIYFISDSSGVRVRMDVPENWTFALYNPGPMDADEVIDNEPYALLESVASDNIRLNGQRIKLDGKEVYGYQLLIICRSDVEGEFIEEFYINEIPYKVGAQFYGENESLKINLANQGTEIPDMVCKAIYGSDLYEDNVDWVLLNRKFRELLTSHLDVMDNKGSYKSLQNALQWFEYGNLVELREVWKYNTPDGAKYYEQPISKMVTDDIKHRMFNSAKSTYFALRHLKRRIVGKAGQDPTFKETMFEYDPEFVESKDISCLWSEEEMKLKMVLLGNFFETYFMPVHTDLIRSVVEDVVYHRHDISYGAAETTHDENDVIGSFDFSWGDDKENGVDPFSDHEVPLGEIHAYAGLAQEAPYGRAFENESLKDRSSNPHAIPMIACHTFDEPDNGGGSDDVNAVFRAAFMGQVYNGIGAIETAHFSFPEPIVVGKCISNQWGELIETSFSGISKPSNKFDIKFLFPAPGKFAFYFDFIGQSGKHYTKNVPIVIADNLFVYLTFYKIMAKPYHDYVKIDPFTSEAEFTNIYSLEPDIKFEVLDNGDPESTYNVKSIELNPAYTQFIPAPNGDALNYTKITTAQWIGPDCIDKCNAYYNSLDKTNYWVEQGDDREVDENGNTIPAKTAWIRVCDKRPEYVVSLINCDATRIFETEAFFPELHNLVRIKPREIISRDHVIVCVPELIIEGDERKRINYSLLASEPYWEFYSLGTKQTITEFDRAIKTPMLARSNRSGVPAGMYKVKFNYRFGITERTIESNPDWVLK